MRGMRFSPQKKQYALKMWLEEKVDIAKVAYRMKCTERTLWRWKSQYDGTPESLANASSRPHTPHPNSHTQNEIEQIKKIFEENPNISYSEAFGRLRTECAYSRTYFGFWRFVVKSGIRPPKQIIEKYIEQPYNTPEMFGVKMQLDVKVVPRECKTGEFKDEKDFQYTMIDEATRERFIYPYKEQSTYSTIEWLNRYNNRPHSSLRNRAGKRVWLTPLEKRAELMEDYQKDGFKDEFDNEFRIRFLRKVS